MFRLFTFLLLIKSTCIGICVCMHVSLSICEVYICCPVYGAETGDHLLYISLKNQEDLWSVQSGYEGSRAGGAVIRQRRKQIPHFAETEFTLALIFTLFRVSAHGMTSTSPGEGDPYTIDQMFLSSRHLHRHSEKQRSTSCLSILCQIDTQSYTL